MASEYPARGAAGQAAAPARTSDPSAPEPAAPSSPLPAAAFAVVGDALLTTLWTATRDLDAHPGRRRLARSALALAIAPRAAAALRTPRAGDLAPSAPAPHDTATRAQAGAQPGARPGAAGTSIAWGVGGTLAALTLAGSHWAEAAAVRRLRDRGVPHAGTVLGVALGVVQLLGTAGIEAAARRRSTSTTGAPTTGAPERQAGWTQR